MTAVGTVIAQTGISHRHVIMTAARRDTAQRPPGKLQNPEKGPTLHSATAKTTETTTDRTAGIETDRTGEY